MDPSDDSDSKVLSISISFWGKGTVNFSLVEETVAALAAVLIVASSVSVSDDSL